MIYLCTMPPCPRKEPSAHYYCTSATFFPSPIQLQSTPGAPFLLTSPIPPVRRWLVVHHPLISLHTTTHRSEQPPCDFEQPTPLPTSDPSTSISSPFRQTRLRNQTRVARFWVLDSLGSAGRRIVESVTTGTGKKTDGFGLEPTSIQPTHYAHNLAPAIQISAVYPAPRTYITHFIACTSGISCSTKARQIDNRSIFTLPRGPDPPDLLLWTWDTPIREIRTQREFKGRLHIPHRSWATESLGSAKLEL